MVSVAELKYEELDFFDQMGPFFGSRSVAKEAGINLYADEDKRWFAATEYGRVIGFASLRGRLVSDCFVVHDKRKLGVFTNILQCLLSATSGPLKANCTRASLKAFQNAGFVPKRFTKNFTYVELERA